MKLDNAAGGECNVATTTETTVSIASAGLVCAILGITGTVNDSIGQKEIHDGRICNR